MQPLPSPNTINSANARSTPNPTHWAAIYRPISNMLGVPNPSARNIMRSSKSNMNLKALPENMENLAVDRTANSTPANHRKDLSMDRGVLLTPPSDKKIEPPNSNKISKEYLCHENGSNIYLKSQAEDDVFSGDTQPNPESASIVPTELATPIAPVAGQEVIEYAANNTIAPRPDRLMDPITPANAQGVLAPASTVFVANLSVHRTDQELAVSCHEAFDQFGTCALIVRRDKRGHPYALISYYTAKNADRAVKEGREIVIDGRTVRTEHGDVHREYNVQGSGAGSPRGVGSVILSRIGGGAITTEEARELLVKYGPVEALQPTTHADGRIHGVPEGMWAKFAYQGDYKDCLTKFNNLRSNNAATSFRVSDAPKLEPRTRPGIHGGSPVPTQGLRTPRSSTDQKSIFVGNLPDDTTEAELLEIFAVYGEIKGCNVIRKPITGGEGFNIFGFIEYGTAAEAETASEAEIDIRGQRIRVEPKEYSARRHTRLQPYGGPPSADRLPRGITWGPSANGYQTPSAPMPYGFQPIYLPPSQGGLPHLPPGYTWTATPPNSAHRPRAPAPQEYFMAGSPPQQYLPMHPAAYAVPTYRDSGAENPQEPPTRRY